MHDLNFKQDIGIRGVFDGVIENMHLHWKHRELVKLISKEKELSFVEETARILEYESGGILVSIDRVPKGHDVVFYRGKNYYRPLTLRPRNLLTKAKALKRRMALQRYEALSQHISELEKNIEQIKQDIGGSTNVENSKPGKSQDHNQSNSVFADRVSHLYRGCARDAHTPWGCARDAHNPCMGDSPVTRARCSSEL